MSGNDDFYVGYVPAAPVSTARWMKRVIVGVVAAGGALALVLTASQARFPDASFEYGQFHTFAGRIHATPVPTIQFDTGRQALLVAPGKHGADPLVRALDGSRVDLAASRIHREDDLMLELVPGSIRKMGDAVTDGQVWSRLGDVDLRGEIVDSKCYLGVMNPGEGKVHRDCAARCVSGGVPPALIAADRTGRRKLLLLTTSDGRSLGRELLSFVAEPVSVRGTLYRSGEIFRIETELPAIRRIP